MVTMMELVLLYVISVLVTLSSSQIFTLPHKMAVLFFYEEEIVKFLIYAETVSPNAQVQAYITNYKHRVVEVPQLGKTELQVLFVYRKISSVENTFRSRRRST